MNALEYLFNFDRMFTPVLIRFTFVLLVVLEIIIGLVVLFMGGRNGINGVLWGLLIILGAPFITRIIAELTILLFQMNERLADIKELLPTSNATEEAKR